ncbi:MAG: hypothetical protein K9L64_02695 [Candidatus Izimaplasma sp.]|nr:hypothetical protein [Candidatus Izimaplasma bacterium]
MKDDFYYQLNQSHRNLDNKAYIKTTTKIMDSALKKQDSKKNILVIGAGNLSDFDLNFFLEHFKKIYLSDIDILSIEKALKEKISYSQINIKQIDYIGIRETNFFTDFFKLKKVKEYKDIEHIFQNKINQLKSYYFSKEFICKFDTIYISPIYTQLLYREAEAKLEFLCAEGFSEEYKNRILLFILQSMRDIIDSFNMEIINLLEENGTLFVSSDIFYLSEDSFSANVKKAIPNHEHMEKIYLNYQNEYGYGLGDFGLYSLSEKLKTIQEKWLLWGKKANNSYAVKFVEMKK